MTVAKKNIILVVLIALISYDWNNISNKNKPIYLFSDNFVYETSKMVMDLFSRRIN